jgi:sterol desaturase/sphingolipid hydroxylase (fatty acid hydroxylase superfamily)
MKESSQLLLLYISAGMATFYLTWTIIEFLWSRKSQDKIYSTSESLASLSSGLIHQIINLIVPMAAKLYFMTLSYKYAFFHLPNGVAKYLIAFLLTDLFYYLQHMLNHKLDIFWSLHQVHHSSLELNLTTGARVSWLTPIVASFFFCPLTLIGIEPELIILNLSIVFYGQWWCHSRYIGKLGFIEKIFNTPSSHRVHHVADSRCQSNYAGLLIIWDRIFGTYIEETSDMTEYGTPEGFVGYNPFWLNFRGPVNYIRSLFSKQPRPVSE